MKRIKIVETAFRDAHQSLLATRMRTRDMLPIAEDMDKVGFFSLEAWGGATFDTCIRYLNEDPWERLRKLDEKVKKTPIQMLLRGQNLVGYKHYPDDIVKKFVEKAYENGVDIFRIFDALNDIRNMEYAIKVAKDQGAHVQGTICYTISPYHTLDKYVEFAKELEALECDSVAIKDMAGLISPHDAYELVKALKEETDLLVNLHCHCTSGMTPMSYYAACQAGVDILDTAISPLSWGASQPPTESVVAALKDTPYDTGLDLKKLTQIKKYFEEIREKYKSILDPIAERIDTDVLIYQIPGGMLSNLVAQLKEQDALDRYDDVLKEMPRVRKDMGYPPLVTPTSQIVGIQAVMNVLSGERYKMVSNEVKDYFRGLYGRPPAPLNPEVAAKIIGDQKPIDCRPADILEPQFEKYKREGEKLGIIRKEEDILTFALYPTIAPKFLRGEIEEEPLKPPKEAVPGLAEAVPTQYLVEVDGDEFEVKVIPTGYLTIEEKPKKPEEPVEGAVESTMQGMIVKLKVKEGDIVEEGDVVAVIEAMKMENDIQAPHSGVVEKIYTQEGEKVEAGDILMVIK
ncbi:sodium-extruding oxaloacetate decarboxylase subunit alpha [Methanothermobacter tenebrarum]|uniref:Pyruvate carboxylase subunit B n=1 Tax=Methanothermobacter tenebrarum TaxID=680118 RepID=A0A328PE54_9EURY|nr:sodium-extruding oxaloacetate decarboxylase subunit alpha [Methanothermobacter tenebrarum]MBC7101184.1 sodium-extruding oxaloacetate decarboxylase subunit alpha [Methanobacteriales archaeon]NPV65127.1 sodium-extruding oxaloacetate decarboxylase subunit alpha [Methanobacteriaceae archaeon]RAO79501.1 oxaloacetate decarboxylase subunit alpha [Methanothermobacter tenebrarum]